MILTAPQDLFPGKPHCIYFDKNKQKQAVSGYSRPVS